MYEAREVGDAKLTLAEGANSFELINDAKEDTLKMSDGHHDLVRIARSTGSSTIRGDLTLGGPGI